MGGSWLQWAAILRLGLIQTAIGAITVFALSTLNRVMIVEMALPASLPAGLVAWHYAVQLSRPRWGHGADIGENRRLLVIFGVGIMAVGSVLAANAAIIMAGSLVFGIVLGILAYTMIGAGIAASGTSVLTLLAIRVEPHRRPAAAAIAWIMMISGIVVTAAVLGQVLDPFSPQRLAIVASGVAGTAFIVALLAVGGDRAAPATAIDRPRPVETQSFGDSVKRIWREKTTRDFTVFVFVSMLAYSAQELILEPYAGLVFGLSLGKSTQLAAFQHGGVLIGMALLGFAGTYIQGDRTAFLQRCTVFGCLASAMALVGLSAAGFSPAAWPLRPMVLAMGVVNGLFAVSAIGMMMSLAGADRKSREGIRLGVWGAAQAAAFGLGGFAGAAGLDLMRHLLGSGPTAFATIFGAESLGFVFAAIVAQRLGCRAPSSLAGFAAAEEQSGGPTG
ncbi:MAG TPA: BCD family MFS transporter [Rhodospirillaceae bacterium]|nr:BCD family MFS transporter [Rhodospirillaceae bacterium]